MSAISTDQLVSISIITYLTNYVAANPFNLIMYWESGRLV